MKRNRLFEELLANVPEETKRKVEKAMTCAYYYNGGDCAKGLLGTPCKVVGCVAWREKENKI